MTDATTFRSMRLIPAPRERVFEAWTDPDQLRRWWGPGLFTTSVAQMDLRPGGRYELVMQPPEGQALILVGTFREVRPPERLVYTWRWEAGVPSSGESIVTVEFHDRDGATEVVLTHADLPPGESVAPYRDGWESGLDKLERTLTGTQPRGSHPAADG